MLPVDRLATAFKKKLSGTAIDVGHLPRGGSCALHRSSPSARIVTASGGLPDSLTKIERDETSLQRRHTIHQCSDEKC
jgi:hypothetical protein